MKIKKIYDFKRIEVSHSLKEAIQMLGESEYKILFVVKNNSLLGTLTDGDIRRALSRNSLNLNEEIARFMNESPKYISEQEYQNSNKDILKKKQVNYLPVINENKEVQFVLFFDINFQLQSELKNKVVIMAGGKGTRLLPLTRVVPKALVPFKDKTIIEKIMEQFLDSGFKDFILTLNYKASMIEDYLAALDYNVSCIIESDFLGTAGSIGLLDKLSITEPFFVSNCDILLNIDFYEALIVHKREKTDITIFGSLENIDMSYGILESDNNGEFCGIKEKPNLSFLVNTGIYILNPLLIDLVGKNERLDMPDLIDRAKKEGMSVKVFPVPDKMTDIGQWEYYKKFLS